ncbi:hypothetical protein FDP25_06695 [Roseovarius sp. A21]|uniref:Uncharacterized protein n=1 Tax=Roseovarius bejariae TaxID=2576383 RepID=A0A844CNS1_9RHOB|nr:hypothetical protein [Roseovarius bejariae]MRU15115.1 hypothetical protein [Roseovarius bejariae]
MPLKPLITLVFLAIAAVVGPGAAQTARDSREQIIDLLGRLPEIAPVRDQLVAQGFRGEKLALAEEHTRLMMNDRLVAGYIADRLIALYDGDLSAGVATEGLIAPLYDSGITHLSLPEMRFFHQMQRALLDGMSTRNCGLIVKGTMRPQRMEDTLGRAETHFTLKTLRTYYRIQRKAVRLGVTRAPKQLSPLDRARIEQTIAQALRARVASEENAKSLARTFDNLERARPVEACAAGKLFADVILDMEGQDLRDALLYLGTL